MLKSVRFLQILLADEITVPPAKHAGSFVVTPSKRNFALPESFQYTELRLNRSSFSKPAYAERRSSETEETSAGMRETSSLPLKASHIGGSSWCGVQESNTSCRHVLHFSKMAIEVKLKKAGFGSHRVHTWRCRSQRTQFVVVSELRDNALPGDRLRF